MKMKHREIEVKFMLKFMIIGKNLLSLICQSYLRLGPKGGSMTVLRLTYRRRDRTQVQRPKDRHIKYLAIYMLRFKTLKVRVRLG